MIILQNDSKKPLYVQLYQHFKREIECKKMTAGQKLPSIRNLAQSLSLSKITIEKAYQQLISEGYIESGNRSRHTVCHIEEIAFQTLPRQSAGNQDQSDRSRTVRYDFSSGEMDKDGFDFSLWKRCINKVLHETERLASYGAPQGEKELRQQIASYIRLSRGVETTAEEIVIGPGVQSLLKILCSLLKDKHSIIAFEEPGFRNGRRIFADHDFAIVPIGMNKDGIDMNELGSGEAKLLYLSPSHQFPTGHIMPIGKRNNLLNWAEKKNALIIEDDYDSEFRYAGRPIPALKGLDKRGNVVYLGSFSKIIPPSVRISFMVMPPWLLEEYREKSFLFTQAASTLEQLALARFMADGHFDRQVRRLRKLYAEKSILFHKALAEVFGSQAAVSDSEAGLHTVLRINSSYTARQLVERALDRGCAVAAMEDYYFQAVFEEQPQLILYFSKIPAGELRSAVMLLKEACF